MTFLIWNVRGMNTPTRKPDILKHVNNLKVSVVSLLEYKLSDANIKLFVCGYIHGWDFRLNEHINKKSRICVMWDTNCWQFNVISSNQQAITGISQNLGVIKSFLP